MAVNDVKKIYKDIIDDVCTAVREKLSEEGYDDHTLQELKNLWLTKLENSKALEPIPISAVDHVTTREFRHPNPGESSKVSSLSNKQSTGMRINHLHPASTTAVNTYGTSYPASAAHNPGLLSMTGVNSPQLVRPSFPNRPPTQTNIGNNAMKTLNQLDGTNDEIVSANSTKRNTKCGKKKSKYIEISFQLDGTVPPVGDDDDEDDDSELEGNDAGEELDDDDDDEGNEEGKEDPNPLCSDDDVSDDEPAQLFDTDNVVVCQYDKISRIKSKWRFVLKSGVMNIEGHDYVFSKATGDADW